MAKFDLEEALQSAPGTHRVHVRLAQILRELRFMKWFVVGVFAVSVLLLLRS